MIDPNDWYESQDIPEPPVLVTEGERTPEGALDRFRHVTDGALEKFRESIHLKENAWQAAVRLRDACEAAALEYRCTLANLARRT